MIDGNALAELIENRRPFKIGTRGICIRCIPVTLSKDRRNWVITIDRAFVNIECTDISILDDEDFYHLTYELDNNGTYYSLADLTKYDKLTVIQ